MSSFKCECNCTFKNNSFITALFLTTGFTLSFLSSLDCFLLEVDVGFVAKNTFYNTSVFGIGLWTFEDPDVPGRCISPAFANDVGGLTREDNLYKNILLTDGDAIWSATRVVAAFGLVFGFAAMIFVWVCLCMETHENFQTSAILFITTITLACEGVKFGLFFDTQPCISETFWELVDEDEVSYFVKADNCRLSRGTYMAFSSMVSYLIVILSATLARLFPSYHHVHMDEGEMDIDAITLPSLFASFGKSMRSRFSRNTGASRRTSAASRRSSTASRRSSAASRRSSATSLRSSTGSNAIQAIMEPIVEGNDDEYDDFDRPGGRTVATRSTVTRSTITRGSKYSSKSGGNSNYR